MLTSNGRTRRPAARSQAASALRASATPCPSAAACTTMPESVKIGPRLRIDALDPGELQPQPPAGVVVVVQQHVVAKVLRPPQRVAALEQRRSCTPASAPRRTAGRPAGRDSGRAPCESPTSTSSRAKSTRCTDGADAQIDLGMRGCESGRGAAPATAPRTRAPCSPSRGRRRARRSARRSRRRSDRKRRARPAGSVCPSSVSRSPRGSRRNSRTPSMLLEPSDLMADRRLGDVQLAGGAGEAEVSRRGLERAQRRERRQTAGHRQVPGMSSIHVFHEKRSFVKRLRLALCQSQDSRERT